MKKTIWILLCIILILPNLAKAGTIDDKVKVAFFRGGFLWTKINGKEEKITKTAAKYYFRPQWSHDGKWILYQVEPTKKQSPNPDFTTEIWVYNVGTKKHIRISYDGLNPKWSPVENIVAFKSDGVLNVSNIDRFYNVALGVGDYNWFPDGRSFIASSVASLRPDGWTNPILYKIALRDNQDKVTSITENVKQLFTIPSELKKGNVSILSIDATDFQFSPDGKWISFIVGPTASWSMDSNMVCVISSEGQNFQVLDEIIHGVDHPQWAFHKNLLGYIAGGGRIVFGFKNKDMKVTELPAFQSLSLTPAHFAELGFTWRDDNSLIVSRVKESKWSNKAKQRPDPSLYLIKIAEKTQTRITNPPKDFGDYHPSFIPVANTLVWLRKKDIANPKNDLWISGPKGSSPTLWIKNIEGFDFSEGSPVNKKSHAAD